MVRKRKIIALSIAVIILLSVSVLNAVSGNNENFDEAEKDLAPLIQTLDRMKLDIENSLKEASKVYNLTENDFSKNYTENLNRSSEIAEGLEEELSKPNLVLEEIRNEVESAEYLDEYFFPFRDLSLNLTHFTKGHTYLVSNLSVITQMIEGKLNESDYKGGNKDDLLGNSLNHLARMNRSLTKMGEILESIDYLDVNGLKNLIIENKDLVSEYKALLNRLIEGEESTFLTIDILYGPNIGHAGASIDLYGNYRYEGNKTTNTTIQIYKDDNKIDNVSTFNGFYEYTYNISWNQPIGETMNFSARTEIEGENISSKNLSVKIVPYSSNLELKKEKDVYYNETIEIFGVFETEADMDLSNINLTIYKDTNLAGTINPSDNGTFSLIYDSKEFKWGKTNLTVGYPGNRTISDTSEDISIVSMSNEIVFLEYTKRIEEGAVDEFSVKGRLINISSGKGLEDHHLNVFLNGEHIDEVQTGKDGNFTFFLPEGHDIETGKHTLRFSFEGSEKYSNVYSEDIQIEVIERTMFWNSPIFLSIALMAIIIFSVGVYFFEGEKGTDRKLEGEVEDVVESPSTDVSILAATSKDEIPGAYRDLLQTLQDSGLITISSGKTHREIEDEINSHPRLQQLEEDINRVTELFEKALFTDRSIQTAELEKFNSSLSRLTGEVSS